MADQLTTIVGTICKEDPTLKFSPQGHAICTFSVRVPGTKAKDGKPATEAVFHNVVAWRELGEHVAESIKDKDRVIVRGVVKTREYDKQDGTKGTSTEINAWNVGPDLSYVTAEIARTERTASVSAPAVAAGYESF